MPFVLNAWYVIAWPHEVTADAVLARTVCDNAMVLWRSADGHQRSKTAARIARCLA